jgi:hypothetical protein
MNFGMYCRTYLCSVKHIWKQKVTSSSSHNITSSSSPFPMAIFYGDLCKQRWIQVTFTYREKPLAAASVFVSENYCFLKLLHMKGPHDMDYSFSDLMYLDNRQFIHSFLHFIVPSINPCT